MNLSANYRLKAFTLLELMIGMIVSAIVLGAVFTALNITHRQYLSFGKTSSSNKQLSFFLSTINSDFNGSKTILNSKDRSFEFQSSTRTITYDFHQQYILRKDAETDTFFVAVPELTSLMNSETVNEKNSTIDELQLTLEIDGKDELLLLKKFPDAKTKLEANERYLDFLKR